MFDFCDYFIVSGVDYLLGAEDVSMVEFMYLKFACMPGESYCR